MRKNNRFPRLIILIVAFQLLGILFREDAELLLEAFREILRRVEAHLGGYIADDYVFMADMWNPKHLSDSRHLWIPISWENGALVLKK